MKGKIIIGLIFVMVFISLVSASIEHTASTDTICNGQACTKTLYSGIRNVYEDNQWKKVEEAKSLKGKGFYINVLEEDPEYPIEVIDFNYSSIHVKLNPKGIKIFNENIPLRIWRQNDTKEQKFYSDVADGKKQIKGIEDYKEKMDKKYEEFIGFNLLNQEEEMIYVGLKLGDIIEFGHNSTTITLDGGDILDDTIMIWDDTTSNGASTSLEIDNTPIEETIIKFDISSLPMDGSINITLANLTIQSKTSGGSTVNSSVYMLENQTWSESEIMNQTHRPYLQINNTLIAEIIITNQDNWIHGFDITNGARWIYDLNYGSLSVLINSSVSGKHQFDSSESTGSSHPQLRIDYHYIIPPDVIINSPLNKTYNTNSILFNVTVLGYETIDTCEYSLTNGEINNTMVNVGDDWTDTNSTMLQGSHTANFYCNDTVGNLNASESIIFNIQWGGSLWNRLKLDENSGTIAYDVSEQGNNGTNAGATWENDGIINNLVQDIDYLQIGDMFTIINDKYAWDEVNATYDITFTSGLAGYDQLETFKSGVGGFSNWIAVIVITIMAGIILALVLIAFPKRTGV